jgi:uncharacterized membrane protein
VPGSIIDHAGIVHVEPAGGGTRVHAQMSCNPPGGAGGHGVATVLGGDPKRAFDDGLAPLKSLLEGGRTTARGHTVTRHDAAS